MVRRISRLLLLGRCLLYALVRGRAVRTLERPRAIAVVLTGKLGDIVCGTPVLRAVRKHYPHARLVAAGSGVGEPLLEHSGLCDEYINIDAPDAAARISAAHADAALLCGPSFLPAAFFYLSGTPLVVLPAVHDGYSPIARAWPYRLLRLLCASYPYRMGAYAPRERLRALEPLGVVEDDTRKELAYSERAGRRAGELLGQDAFLVGMSVTAGNKAKEWPEERFARVADHIIKKHNAKVIFIGGSEDRGRVGRVMNRMEHRKNVMNTEGMLTLDELKALISRLNLFVAVDTGPIYIAEAFGVPTIDIVGPMDEGEQPPRGPLHRCVIPPERKGPAMQILNARGHDLREVRRQTLAISPEAVIAELDSLVSILRK